MSGNQDTKIVDWEDYVGNPMTSQKKNVPDIHYLWGPGRLLAQQMQRFSAFLFFVSFIAFAGGAKALLDTSMDASNDRFQFAAQSGAAPVLTPLRPKAFTTPDRCEQGIPTYDILSVGGDDFNPADTSIDWRRVSAAPSSAVRDIVLEARDAVRDDPRSDPWSELNLAEMSVEDFWKTAIPFSDEATGSIARATLPSGVEYIFVGTYIADARETDLANRCNGKASGDGMERRPAPVIFIQRTDPSAKSELNRSITYVLQDHRLGTIRGSTILPLSLLHIAQEFRAVAPDIEIVMDGTESLGREWNSVPRILKEK